MVGVFCATAEQKILAQRYGGRCPLGQLSLDQQVSTAERSHNGHTTVETMSICKKFAVKIFTSTRCDQYKTVSVRSRLPERQAP